MAIIEKQQQGISKISDKWLLAYYLTTNKDKFWSAFEEMLMLSNRLDGANLHLSHEEKQDVSLFANEMFGRIQHVQKI